MDNRKQAMVVSEAELEQALEETAPVPTIIKPSQQEPRPCLVVTVGDQLGRVIFVGKSITIGRGRVVKDQELLAGDRIQVGKQMVLRLDYRAPFEVEEDDESSP